MEIRVLGPLEVSEGTQAIPISGTKRRLLLTLLALGAPRPVTLDRLIEALWGDSAADAAGATLQTYVYQLRRILGAETVTTQPRGYALGLPGACVDVWRFEHLIDRTDEAETTAPAARRGQLVEALELWRGTPLAEFPDVPSLVTEATRLDGLRLRALEERIDADLALGRHGAVVGELEQLVAEQPLRERFWAQLMVALYRSDRQADALRAYARLRRHLGEELGLEPSPALAHLEQQILDHDSALTGAALGPAETARPAAREPVRAVFLFSDMEGSTRRWEATPDAMSAALAEHDRLLRAIFEEHGGRVFGTAGDSFAVRFTDAVDAVAAALDTQLALHRADWSAVGGLNVRMGLHLGAAYERSGVYFGPTVNRAARLHAAAHGGQVLLSAATAAAVGDQLPAGASLIDLGDHRLRDLGQPERIHQLAHPDLRVEFPPLKAEARPDAEAPPFIGRGGELDHLSRRVDRLRHQGRGGVVMLIGEAGIGKTRTAENIGARARADGVEVLVGRCVDGPWAPPYGPFAEALAAYVRASGRDAVAALGSWAPVLARLLPDQLPFETPDNQDLDTAEQRIRVFASVAGFFTDLAADAPILVLLDDLHWADQATISLLRYVARATATSRVLLLGTFRDTEVGSGHPLSEVLGTLPRETDYERVRLRGLPPRDVADLARAVLDKELPDDVLSAVAADTGGNPFFVHQVLRQLQSRDEGADIVPEAFAVPATVLDVVDHRVLHLPDVAQRFLRAAAVFDGDFEFAVAADVAGLNEDDALDALDSALDAHLLDPADGTDSYRFTHALARQALAAYPNPSRLVRAHRRAAEALVAASRGPLDPAQAAEVAAHYQRSRALEGAEKGVPFAVVAADHAEATGAHDEAVGYLDVALELLPSGDPAYPNLLGRLGCAHAQATHYDAALATMNEAFDLITTAQGERRAAEYALAANLALFQGLKMWDVPLLETGLRYIGDDRDVTWATLYVTYVNRSDGEDWYRAARTSEDFVEASKILLRDVKRFRSMIAGIAACRDRADVRRLREWPSIRMFLGGELRTVLPEIEAESASARSEGRLLNWAQSHAYEALCHVALGDLDRGEDLLDEVFKASLPGTPSVEVEERLMSVAYLLASARGGEWDKIERFANRSAELMAMVNRVGTGQETSEDMASLKSPLTPPGFIIGLAKVSAVRGARDQAVKYLPLALPELNESIRTAANGWDHLSMVHEFVEVLWYAEHREHLDEAERAVRDVLEPDFRGPMADMRLSMARLEALRGDTVQASEWFEASRQALEETGARTLRAVVDFDEALMHRRLGADGDVRLARDRLTGAIGEFGAMNMRGWLERAHALAAEL